MADPKIAPSPEPVRVPERDVTLAEHGRQAWRVVARGETTAEDTQHPAYLWHVHSRMRVHDLVEIVHERDRFMVWLLITRIDTDTQSVLARVLNVWDFAAEAPPLPDLAGARVENMGDVGKWSVIQGTATLSAGHASKRDAETWLKKKQAGE